MSDAAAPAPAKKASKPKKPRAPAAHPKTIDMIVAAITNLKERNGSSLQAIKKYIGANYKVDVEKITPFVRRCLKSGVTSGKLVQTKGKGASGSFKLNPKTKAEKKPKKPKAKKPKAKKPKAAKKATKKPKEKKPKAKKPKAKKPKAKAEKKPKKTPTKKPKAAKKAPAKKVKKSPKKKAASKKK
uniref:Histone H1E-like n=1 Tax=Saccoglossus kowalevskii TaxID=10224 RepID=A0ABM0GVX7_SACKO|nr:PREDICTED: histone H1E-like [Saccoglossus kowalevskii]